jgi:hypothetical protein
MRTPDSGALVLTAKSEETSNHIRYAEICGRKKDAIVFSEKSGYTFDPLAYEWSRLGLGSGERASKPYKT